MNYHARIMLACCLLVSAFTAHVTVTTNSSTLSTQNTVNTTFNPNTAQATATNAINTSMPQTTATHNTNTLVTHAAKIDYRPSNTAIVFDVDDVIIKRAIPIFSLAWRYKIEILKALFNFRLMKDVFTLIRMTAPVGMYIALFERKQPGLVPFARELITTRTTDPKTVAIIKTLLSLGYELHIGTNETANEFILHQERFPLFSRFTTYTFADYSAFPDVTQKPQLRYFERMKDRILAYNKKTTNLIFIDDRTDNVQAARDTGYFGIVFTTPEALEATLVKMDIMPPISAKVPMLPVVAL